MHRAGGWICCRRPHADTHRETAITVLPQVDRSLDRMMIYTGKTHTARKMEKEKKEKLWKTCENEKEERLYVYVYIKELDHYIFHGWYSIHTHTLFGNISKIVSSHRLLFTSFIFHFDFFLLLFGEIHRSWWILSSRPSSQYLDVYTITIVKVLRIKAANKSIRKISITFFSFALFQTV